MKCDSEITEIKNADIPIMDIASTGSLLTKQKIDEVKPKVDAFTLEEVKEEKEAVVKPTEGQMSFADFTKDFKI